MRSVIQWAVRNSPAMNTLMVATLIVGAVGMISMRREVFPEFEMEIVLISVPYPGASPEEVEEGICSKIEEAVRSIDGVKKLTSVAAEGAGSVILELYASIDVQKALNEVRSEVDRIPSFPELAEDPDIKQITMRQSAIRVGVIGPDSETADAEFELREVAEQVRNDLLTLPNVSQANLMGARDYQIDVEISEDTLRKYGLTLQKVANIVRRENVELPGGNLKTESQEVLLRGKNKGLVGEHIEDIPLVTQANGVVLMVGDLGVVRDDFVDTTAISRINSRPGLVVSVNSTSDEDIIAITADVNEYVNNSANLPAGYELVTWGDRSVEVADRLELLSRNGLQGLLLVFLALAIFLELRLAFWVALGIPVAVFGGCAVLFYMGHTLNMLTTFAFLMALGIVVDDAIVIGENIYAHRQQNKDFVRAAVEGTIEVLPSVFASVTTTIIAFTPLMYVTGMMGKFIAVLPVAVIAMLIISLVESALILPCHLAHGSLQLDTKIKAFAHNLPLLLRWTVGVAVLGLLGLVKILFYPLKRLGNVLQWISGHSDDVLNWIVDRVYLKSLGWSLNNPGVVISSTVALLIVSVGLYNSGIVPWSLMPKMDSESIEAMVAYPDGTPGSITDAATLQLQEAVEKLNERYEAQNTPVVAFIHRSVGEVNQDQGPRGDQSVSGAHLGSVSVQLVNANDRPVDSEQLVTEWRELAGEFPGVEKVTFGGQNHGPGGKLIEFKLVSSDGTQFEDLEAAVEECKTKLATYPGVFDIADDAAPGKWEYQIRVKDEAKPLGVTVADLAETVRGSYYGEEVMRLQRGRHEVKLMVRYPREDRRSLANFDEIRVRTAEGAERPLTALADVSVARGDSEINRVNQMRSITITADVDEVIANASDITRDLRTNFLPALFADYPGVDVRWEGQAEQTTESLASLFLGLAIAMFAMYVLLTLEFRSYLQPLLILSIIPFGVIGAIGGHALLGRNLTLFSLFGLVALTGVVVNDSIVLIDFINHRIRDGLPLRQALLDAGRRRFRPVLLTSVTTIAGLLPILTETSSQAQIVIPMATSLSFGLMFATLLVLFLIPVYYSVYARLTGLFEEQEQDEEPHEESSPVIEELPEPAFVDELEERVEVSAS